MLLLILFAFLGGIVTVLSPCVLPILPIILGSTTGGKKKPFGIVLGFILSFTFFTLFLSTIVNLTGISAQFLRYFSILVIFFFGISLLFSQTQIFLEKLFSKFSQLIPKNSSQKNGLWGGILIGFSLGLLWTPCVGPILASVISLSLIGKVTFQAFIITFFYSLGTAIPMFAIIYGGQNLLNNNRWLLTNSAKIQKAFGIIMILTAISIYFNFDRKIQTFVLNTFPKYGTSLTSFEDNNFVNKALDNLNTKSPEKSDTDLNKYPLAPEIIPGGEWINSNPILISALQNKVILVDFWTYSCINCIRTLPYLKAWWEKYEKNGLVIIGVHTPEFEFEKNINNLQKAVLDFDLKYPIVQDNNYSTWRAYNNRYWPAKYLIDKNGRVRYTHFGEGKYDETEKEILKLLNEISDQEKISEEINNPNYNNFSQTPETYLGYSRSFYYQNISSFIPDSINNFNDKNPQKNSYSLKGDFLVTEEFINPQKSSTLYFNFYAKNVFLVLNSDTSASVSIYLDDVFVKNIEVTENKLYEIVNLDLPKEHVLRLEFNDNNAKAFAFTFG